MCFHFSATKVDPSSAPYQGYLSTLSSAGFGAIFRHSHFLISEGCLKAVRLGFGSKPTHGLTHLRCVFVLYCIAIRKQETSMLQPRRRFLVMILDEAKWVLSEKNLYNLRAIFCDFFAIGSCFHHEINTIMSNRFQGHLVSPRANFPACSPQIKKSRIRLGWFCCCALN